MTEPALELVDVAKVYREGGGLRGLSLSVAPGRVAAVVGPSGCGKTTALRIAAGLVAPDRGRVLVGGRDVSREPPERRGLGVVFQHYALFPHLTVEGNVGYGLRARGVRGGDLARAVDAAAELVGLAAKKTRRLDELSGGEQQRVAVARALAFSPPVLLLDEPLSNLDLALRRRTREELAALVRRLGLAALHVTHDQEEALAVADELYVLRDGRLMQRGAPEDVYARPQSAFVARFLGGARVLRARVASDGRAVVAPGTSFRTSAEWPAGAEIDLALRPERMVVTPGADGAGVPARVTARTFVGADVLLGLALDGGDVEARVRADDPAARAAVGEAVRADVPGGAHGMPPETSS